ncbi:MAG: hypothetical protein U1E32_11405 [Rhodoglobus sp.]|jgi:hypothetical protein|nr:hypothetical protein [Rhodoglobus sp.]
MSVTERLELVTLTGTGTRVLIWGYVVTMGALAVWTLDKVHSPWPTVLGVITLVAIGVLFTIDRNEPMALTTGVLVAFAWIAIALLVSWQLKEPGGHEQWYYGAGTVSMFYVGLRGRQLTAWLGFAGISAVVAAWAITCGFGVVTAVVLIGKQLPILLVSTLFAYGLQRTTSTILRLSAETSTRASVEAAQLATTAARNDRLAELDAIATPLLARLISGEPLSDSDRLEFAVAEAELRDGLRARSLGAPAVVAAAREARRRGVEVVLLDDLYPAEADPLVLAAVHSRVAAALDGATDGRVVARLLPHGREEVATILVDGESEQRRDVVRAD